ncbi:hypothetical protein, partial [Enterococcus faecalis]|uniref:hypothetical protein n=1 Tax=Enterococcus faecalis TaxID=1351 RepID=UPI0030C7CFAB
HRTALEGGRDGWGVMFRFVVIIFLKRTFPFLLYAVGASIRVQVGEGHFEICERAYVCPYCHGV